jgi:hypothetical protein
VEDHVSVKIGVCCVNSLILKKAAVKFIKRLRLKLVEGEE